MTGSGIRSCPRCGSRVVMMTKHLKKVHQIDGVLGLSREDQERLSRQPWDGSA